MKRLVCLPLSLVLFVSAALAGTAFDQKSPQHRAAHWIILKSESEHAGCSATAVSPRVLLTAQHCYIKDAVVYIDGDESHPHYVDRRVGDDHDSLLLVLTDWPFRDWVPVVRPEDYKAPRQGERAYFWGNPRGIRDIFRNGYVAGAFTIPNDDIAPGSPVYIFTAPNQPGDSGSSIYGEDGRLLGVLTYGIFGGLFTGGYAIDFTDAQLAQAGL